MEFAHAGFQGVLDGQQLLRHHAQHFDVDPVELIEAGPCTALGEAREELAHELVVQVVPAVEDDALHPQGLPEVFCRLRLARPGWTSGRPAQLQVQRPGEGHVAPVRHGGHDEAGLGAEVLVAINERRVHLLEDHVVGALLPVLAELHLPIEVGDGVRLLVDQDLDDVAAVHVDGDKRPGDLALQLIQVLPHDLRQVSQHADVLLIPGVKVGGRVGRRGGEELLRFSHPVDLRDGQNDLRGLGKYPLCALRLGVVLVRLLGQPLQRDLHTLLDRREPLLDVATGLQIFSEADVFALRRHHTKDVNTLWVLAKVQTTDAVEALGHVRLHGLHVLRL